MSFLYNPIKHTTCVDEAETHYIMNELLKKILASEVLTEETKQEFQTAFEQVLSEAAQQARNEARAEVTAELNETWVRERNVLIEALDAKVTEQLSAEIAEFDADVQRFRDHEAKAAAELVEAKAKLAERVKKDLAHLIESLDTFVEVRLRSELTELSEDLAEARKDQFGRKVFEAFINEFKTHYASDDAAISRLAVTEGKLTEKESELSEVKKQLNEMHRVVEMDRVLAPLSGRSREVMEAILKTVDTPMLSGAYNTYIGRVLKESTPSAKVGSVSSEKEAQVLAEGKSVSGVVKSGDNGRIDESLHVEPAQTSVIPAQDLQYWKRLAGNAQ